MEMTDILHHYSESQNPYQNFWLKEEALFSEIKKLEHEFNFPQVKDDVGIILAWISSYLKPKTIFEMGSGYGGSAFWFLSGFDKSKIILTEKREDLVEPFHNLSWPKLWKENLRYYQGDAFKCLSELNQNIDLALIDGVKADYLKFLIELHPKLSDGAIIVVDNTFLKGKILDPKLTHKRAPSSMLKFHKELSESKLYRPCFLPFTDGVTLLSKLS